MSVATQNTESFLSHVKDATQERKLSARAELEPDIAYFAGGHGEQSEPPHSPEEVVLLLEVAGWTEADLEKAIAKRKEHLKNIKLAKGERELKQRLQELADALASAEREREEVIAFHDKKVRELRTQREAMDSDYAIAANARAKLTSSIPSDETEIRLRKQIAELNRTFGPQVTGMLLQVSHHPMTEASGNVLNHNQHVANVKAEIENIGEQISAHRNRRIAELLGTESSERN